MKKILFLLGVLLSNQLVNGQLYISPGADFRMTGSARLTLQNTHLLNNGTFEPGLGVVLFTGDSLSAISGNQYTQFYNLEISKQNNGVIRLFRSIAVTNITNFINGNIELNGNIIDLGSSGSFLGEKESSRVTGTSGYVVVSGTLNNPVNANPGNLGAMITSSKNLGTVLIRRGHKSQVNSYGNGSSILRYYDIIPSNNSNLNATLRFYYFDGELNGISETGMVFWSSNDNIHWNNEYFSQGHNTLNYLEKNGIQSFSRWTISNQNNPLPVVFSLFNLKCEGNKTVLNWKTTQELNSKHFTVEQSSNSIQWTAIGTVPAAGYSNTERSYSFTDNSPIDNSYYRIVQYDVDNRTTYTNIIRNTCGTGETFGAWPNPFTDRITASISVIGKTSATLKLYSSNGALVKKQEAILLPGINQVTIKGAYLPAGSYILSAEWNNSAVRKTVKLIKH